MLGISVELSLSQLAKTLCLSYHCFSLLFNKIGEKGRTGSTWKQGGWRQGHSGWGRTDPNNVCTY
jgi:hypothetical protein